MMKNHKYNLANYPSVSFKRGYGGLNADVVDIIQLSDGTLLSCSFDKLIKRWNDRGQLLISYAGHSADVFCLMELDGNTFISGSYDKSIKVWNKTSGHCLHTIFIEGAVCSLLRLRYNNNYNNNNSTTFLCGMDDGSIRLERMLEVNNFCYETLLQQPQYNRAAVVCMCEMRSNGYIVSGMLDSNLTVWDANTKTLIHTLTGHLKSVHCVTELKGDVQHTTMVASGSDDTTVRIWDVAAGECLQVLTGHKNRVRGLVEVSDGTLLSGSWDKTIKVWNINNVNSNNKNDNNHTVQSISSQMNYGVSWVRLLKDGSIVTGILGYPGDHNSVMELRKTWLSQPPKLYELCCQSLARVTLFFSKFDLVDLEQNLPTELSELVKLYISIYPQQDSQ
eukprot:TRINITY_DN16360_c0_g1_i1.p1 TRINITY_DN16360_c0_g1~~TRINITY_DN16360_c0_g1_i1.p1  ORF type:complete len:391 (+),score=81.02 TRINITY_DN16360_c0_g1_i1:63-1235(+)